MEMVVCILLGALVGSFLNVVILRLPQDESLVFPASHCPKCNKNIRWYDNIPILSFIVLRAQCRYCGQTISWQYPLVEALMAFLSWGLYLKFTLSMSFAIYFLFSGALLAIIFIDFYHQIIPDSISLPGILLGFLLSLINPQVAWLDSLIGIAAGGGFFYMIAAGYYLLTKRAGMGGGDIKFLAMIGAFLGWQSLPFVIFSSALLGSIIGVGAMIKQKKGGKTVVPYGPFLAVGSYLFLFFQEAIFRYMDMYYWGVL